MFPLGQNFLQLLFLSSELEIIFIEVNFSADICPYLALYFSEVALIESFQVFAQPTLAEHAVEYRFEDGFLGYGTFTRQRLRKRWF